MPVATHPPLAEDRALNTAQTRGAATLQDQKDARANDGRGLPDPRRVSVGLLYVESRRMVEARAKGIRKSERETVAAEMVLRISARIEEETDGRAATPWRNRPPLARGKVMRWSDVGFLTRVDDGRALVSADGRRVLHAALKATMDAPRTWVETPAPEILTDPHGPTIGELAEEISDPDIATVPDASAEELARMLDLPITGARLLEGAMSYGRINARTRTFSVNRAACARHWEVTPETAKTIMRDGKRIIRTRYPDPAALLGALDACADALVDISRDALTLEMEERTPDPVTVARAASRYVGAVVERAEKDGRALAGCLRNVRGGVIERTPLDGLAPFPRDGLLAARMAHDARMARAARMARQLLAARASAGHARTLTPHRVHAQWGKQITPDRDPFSPMYAPIGQALAGCGCEICHAWLIAHDG